MLTLCRRRDITTRIVCNNTCDCHLLLSLSLSHSSSLSHSLCILCLCVPLYCVRQQHRCVCDKLYWCLLTKTAHSIHRALFNACDASIFRVIVHSVYFATLPPPSSHVRPYHKVGTAHWLAAECFAVAATVILLITS